MELKKKFELEDGNYNEVHFEVDHSVLTEEHATEINEFWDNAESRLDDSNGNVIEAVLRLAFVTIISMMRSKNWEHILADSAEKFTAEFHQQEGWFECGITVTYVSLEQPDMREISVRYLS